MIASQYGRFFLHSKLLSKDGGNSGTSTCANGSNWLLAAGYWGSDPDSAPNLNHHNPEFPDSGSDPQYPAPDYLPHSLTVTKQHDCPRICSIVCSAFQSIWFS
jgi:hypothetical protein